MENETKPHRSCKGNISWSWAVLCTLFLKQNILFCHISLLNSINTEFTPFKLSGISQFPGTATS